MSSPDTDLEKQTRRHKPALFAMAAAVLFAVVVASMMIGPSVEAENEAAPATRTTE